MSDNNALTQPEKELVAVGAAVAAGCQPCTVHHIAAANAAGATAAEVRQAVADALAVRSSAAHGMARLAAEALGEEVSVERRDGAARPLLGELVSVAAAFAVNGATDLEFHLASARERGATDRQIQTALGVSGAVKKVAARQVDAAVQAAVEPTCPDAAERDRGESGDCGCGDGAAGPSERASTGCGAAGDGVVAGAAGARASHVRVFALPD